MAVFPVAVCLILQINRPDLDFVHRKLPHPFLELYSEYACIIFFFTAPSLLTPHPFCFLISYGLLIAIPLYRPVSINSTAFKKLSRIISPKDFEWISGIRKTYLILIPVYLLALSISWLKIATLALLWLITSVLVSFYEENEDLSMLKANGKKPGVLIRQKFFRHSRYMLLLYTPVLSLNIFFLGFDWLGVNLLFLLTQLAALAFAVFFKYTLYEPHTHLKANSILSGLMVIGSCLPFFLPVPMGMAILYYYKAKKNLNNYLYD